ncbi:MAG TPA: hypothetical protein VMO88_16450 [Acidimicrobiales bacterium]|nr:hypothetical protein [Acidimicrobiales bacterium]
MPSLRVAGNVIRRRKKLVAVIGAVAVAAPLTVFGVTGGGSLLKASSASATSQDYIQYAQGSGAHGSYVEYFPGNGGTPTTDTISSGGGGCSAPTLSPPKGGSGVLLGFPAYDYDTNYATRTTVTSNGKTVSAGAYQQKTGVCGGIGQDYTIDNSGGSGASAAEALDFTIGTDPSVAGRLFSRAQLNLQQQSSATGTVIVELVETITGNAGAPVTECYSVSPGAARVVDTNTPDQTNTPGCANSGNPLLTGFNDIEIRTLTPGGGVSVVGPTSTFFLATQICGMPPNGTPYGATTNGTSTINFIVTLPNGVCKTFTDFEAGQQTINGQPVNVATFDAFSSGAVHYTLTTNWGNQQECSADGSALADGTTTLCPKTQLSLDGQTFTNETYCGGATAADPVCVIKKTYSYSTANSVTSTDIQEMWDALFDLVMRGG